MNVLDSIIPSGDLEQGPFVRSLCALLVGFMLSHMLTAPAISGAIGILPFVVTQLALLWWWFALVVKRLHNAERSILGVGAVAFIDLISILLFTVLLVLQFADLTAGAAAPWVPASVSLLIYPFVFLLNVITGPPANAQDAHIAFLAAFVMAPLLLTIWYSVWAALQPSELHAAQFQAE